MFSFAFIFLLFTIFNHYPPARLWIFDHSLLLSYALYNFKDLFFSKAPSCLLSNFSCSSKNRLDSLKSSRWRGSAGTERRVFGSTYAPQPARWAHRCSCRLHCWRYTGRVLRYWCWCFLMLQYPASGLRDTHAEPQRNYISSRKKCMCIYDCIEKF